MSIEITNNGLSSQAPTPGEESQTGKAQKNVTNEKLSTGKAVESVQITENAKALSGLQKAISSLPVVDTSKVEAAKQLVKNRSLDILGSAEKRLASAERIADKILSIDDEFTEDSTQTKE